MSSCGPGLWFVCAVMCVAVTWPVSINSRDTSKLVTSHIKNLCYDACTDYLRGFVLLNSLQCNTQSFFNSFFPPGEVFWCFKVMHLAPITVYVQSHINHIPRSSDSHMPLHSQECEECFLSAHWTVKSHRGG